MSKQYFRIAIIGCGAIADTHVWALQQKLLKNCGVLVAVCDINETAAVRLGTKAGVPHFTDVSKMLSEVEVDAVIVCTPHMYHDAPAVECLRRGIHVFVEKPLAATPVQADAIIEAARSGGAQVAVCSQREFMEPVRRIREAIARGHFGRLVRCDVRMNGFRSDAYYNHPWKGKMEREGGAAVINQGVHPIAMAIGWMGPVKRVFARMANLTHPQLDTEDSADITVEYESGAIGTFLFTNSQPDGFYTGGIVTGTEGYAEVQTDESMFVAGPDQVPPPPFIPCLCRWHGTGRSNGLTEMNAADAEEFAKIGPPTQGYHVHAIRNFLAGLRGEEEFMVDWKHGLNAVELIAAASHSSLTGEWVDFPVQRHLHDEELEIRRRAIYRPDVKRQLVDVEA